MTTPVPLEEISLPLVSFEEVARSSQFLYPGQFYPGLVYPGPSGNVTGYALTAEHEEDVDLVPLEEA